MSEVIDLEDLDYESVCLPEDYPEARKGSAADSLTDGGEKNAS